MKINIDKRRKNVLPNTYIPVLSKKVLANILSRLPTNSLIQLALLWPRLVHTQPHLDATNSDINQRKLNRRTLEEIKKYLPTKGPNSSATSSALIRRPPTKRKLIDQLLYDYWTKGLNLLQISQVDCQLIVDRPNAYYWISSTVKDRGGFGNEVPISLDPQKFLDQLAQDLNALYMTYIYVCRHPNYPLIIIRIQVFDLQPISSSSKLESARPHISSHKPYFIAIPMNSPHIIHSPPFGNGGSSSNVSKIVLQAVERSLPQDQTNVLKLETPENQKPLRSLETMHILKGNSRFGSSIGIWTPYADGTVDSLPLASVESHVLLTEPTDAEDGKGGGDADVGIDNDPEMARLKKIANLRFKGSQDGKIKSERLFDDTKPVSKRRKKSTAVTFSRDNKRDEIEEDDDLIEEGNLKNEYSTIVPVQYVEFSLKDTIEGNDLSNTEVDESSSNNTTLQDNGSANIVLKLSGSDVYAGLHELSVQTTDRERMIINPEVVPSWLTGEEGASSGIIKDGKFTPI